MSADEEEEEKKQIENAERRQRTPTLNTSTETMEASFEFSSQIKIGRGRPKLIRDRSVNGKNNLKLHVQK